MAAVLCYPYGVTITCVCDNSGSVYNCYPTNYKNKQNNHFNSNSVQVRVDLQDAPKKTSVKEKLVSLLSEVFWYMVSIAKREAMILLLFVTKTTNKSRIYKMIVYGNVLQVTTIPNIIYITKVTVCLFVSHTFPLTITLMS